MTIGGHDWRLRVLSDLQQFADPDAKPISGVIQRHARNSAHVWISDPGRGNDGRFNRLMCAQGDLADSGHMT